MPPLVNLCMPAYRGFPVPESVFSLLNLVLRSQPLLRDVKFRNLYAVDEARNLMSVETLEDRDATHMLCLDNDMQWPPDMVERLLAHGKAVVGAQYFRRTPPFRNTAGTFAGKGLAFEPLPELRPGLRRVDVLGLGATLIETRVLRDMRERFGDEEWFCHSGRVGEDVWFFDRCRQMGVPVYLDGDIDCDHLTQSWVNANTFAAMRRPYSINDAPGTNEIDFLDLYREAVGLVPDGGVMVEVGCFLGRSLIALCKLVQESGKRIRIVAVDHFKGSDDAIHKGVAKRGGGTFRVEFEDNLRTYGVREMVEVVEGDSAGSASHFADGSVDFAFIDASHDYESVVADILAWEPKVKPGCILAGHDAGWIGVRKAIDELLPGYRLHGPTSWRYEVKV